MSDKFQLPQALFTNPDDAGFEIKLGEDHGFAKIVEVRETDVLLAVNIPGVQVAYPKVGVDGPYAVGNAMIFTLEGDLVAVAINPEIVEVATESLQETAPVTDKPKAKKGAGARAQGCAKGDKLEGASF